MRLTHEGAAGGHACRTRWERKDSSSVALKSPLACDRLARPGVLRGGFGALALCEQADEGLHVIVMFVGFQDQLDSHSEAGMHGLHYSLHAQLEIAGAHDDFDTGAAGKGCGHLDVAAAGTDVREAATVGNG